MERSHYQTKRIGGGLEDKQVGSGAGKGELAFGNVKFEFILDIQMEMSSWCSLYFKRKIRLGLCI